MFDVLYVTWFVHLMSLFWDAIWWLYLVIPGFASVKILGFILPMLRSAGGASEEKAPSMSKRQQKKEARGQYVKYARR
jgi:hypothetical protein